MWRWAATALWSLHSMTVMAPFASLPVSAAKGASASIACFHRKGLRGRLDPQARKAGKVSIREGSTARTDIRSSFPSKALRQAFLDAKSLVPNDDDTLRFASSTGG